MNIAGKSISKGEFEYTYRKNTQQQVEKTSLDEYITLFVNYKLKVAEAMALGLDTTKQFMDEFKGYRDQLVKPYMVDKNAEEVLAQEAYNRLLEEVEASHILFKVSSDATLQEKKAVYEKALQVREEAMNGADFAELARQYSEDPSVTKNNGYLGFFGAFRMIYPFEKAAYETPVGEISMPVETQFGYHLIYVSARRKARAVTTAHIMLKVPQSAPEEEREDEAWEIYKKIENGADFAELARQYSEDTSTAQEGGVLPLLTTGQIIPSFENAAFALTEIGEVSKPVRTEFGWHIIKLLSETQPLPYEEMRSNIIRRMSRDDRANAGQKNFMDKLKEDKGFTWNDTTREALEIMASDTAFRERLSQMNEPLFTFNHENYPASRLNSYLQPGEITLAVLHQQFDNYVNDAITDYYATELSLSDMDFNYLLQEYHDGMLLFDISSQKVWDKASEDENGLKKYFKKNKKNYTWNTPHYKGYVLSGDNEDIVSDAKVQLQKSNLPSDTIIAHIYTQYNDSVQHITIENGLYAQGMNATVDYLAFHIGKADTTTIQDICGKILETPESYTDVKGLVISDYQNYLDQEWIKKLRKRYPVIIRKEVLATIDDESEK
ncbi:MAG: peptidylprolyl isomerase [Prevotella sp.]|nr:peptidylprolyl isomerase [Prevotella sp.]